MKHPIRLTLLGLVILVAVVIGPTALRAFLTFGYEDAIHSDYFPVIAALDRYCADKGHAPGSLDALVPDYLEALPTLTKRITDIQLRSSPLEPNWRLTLTSNATGTLRHYIAESGMPLNEQEQSEVVLQYHDRWYVLEPE